MNNDLFESLLILRSAGIGPVKYNDLVQRFGSPTAVVDFMRPTDDLRDAVHREMDMAATMNIRFVRDSDTEYPAALRLLKNHPPILTVRGNIETLRCDTVGIVGTRHATAAGMNFVANLASAFASHGMAVVSGMAIGTDCAAHSGALSVDGNTNTIAVLAGGVDYIWPTENERLYYEILERGAVVSEMPVGFIPKATNFVQRNRIIAGISQKIILGEADMKSGSMKTAEFARDYGREIYAIPSHPSDPRAVGPNSLIRSGVAKMCLGVDDFFTKDKKLVRQEKKFESENPVLDKIGSIPVSESVLAEIVGKSISEIKRELVVLELQGLVQKQDNGYIRL